MTESPWMTAEITVPRAVLDAVFAHAVAEYPSESCGFLTGPAGEPGRVDRAVPAVNDADKMHARDPERFPRTARTFYWINPLMFQRTVDAGAAAGQPVKVVYHSHVDVGAYFSQEDRDGAAPMGELSYPVWYLVTSVRAGTVDDHKLFTLRDGQWVEGVLRVV